MHAPHAQRRRAATPVAQRERQAARRTAAPSGPLDARPALVAQRALAESLNTGPAAREQARLAHALNAGPGVARAATLETRAASRGGAAVVQRQIYDDVETLLADALGGAQNVPALGEGDSDLRALWADAAAQLPVTDVVAVNDLDRTARAKPTPDADYPYLLEYKPGSDPDWLTSSILHELIHVSTAENYEQREGRRLTPWLNLNLPPGLAPQVQDDQEEEDVENQPLVPQAVGHEIEAQQDVLEQNLDDLESVARNDADLPDLDWVLERINYARGSGSHLHYDTVLADMQSYLNLRGDTANATYPFLRRLTREATNRRLVAPWWGTKRTRRVERGARWYEFWKW